MTPVFADVTTTLAWIVLVTAIGGWALYAFFNIRSSRAEIGSEIELAANRKEYYDDETLEGKKLERTQLLGLAFLAVITVTLPLYWILEQVVRLGRKRNLSTSSNCGVVVCSPLLRMADSTAPDATVA